MNDAGLAVFGGTCFTICLDAGTISTRAPLQGFTHKRARGELAESVEGARLLSE